MRTPSAAAAVLLALCCVAAGDLRAVQPLDRDVGPLAAELAANGVPAGFAVPETSFNRGRPSPRARSARERAAFDASLGALLSDFGRAHPELIITRSEEGIVHVEAVNMPADVPAVLQTQLAVPAGELTIADTLALLPALLRGESRVNGIAGVGGALQGCQWTRELRFQSRAMTVSDYLDAVVTSVPGFVWVATYRPESPRASLSVAFACDGGQYTRVRLFQ